MEPKHILFVFAHPDDETFTSGVTICKYAQQPDTTISLVCATRGEAGKAGDPPLCTQAELPSFRERELREAATILGIDNLLFLDYTDKRLSSVPEDELISRIQAVIASCQPQVVVTFAPHGISGHPDHQAISAATTQAVKQLPPGSPVRKLYHVTYAAGAPAGMFVPPCTDPYEAITTEIRAPEYALQVARALAAHRTQHMSVERVFPGVLAGRLDNVRTVNQFMLVWHNLKGYVPDREGKESDLFAGL
ncbi:MULTISPECIES: PIG-L deacetylase family protein [Brevibacillus]|mgnify:FL=1|jgi:LmbE family N-acetylglucosaminyl deacetylase|uniref:PIG-L deacetylase family protein n=1 Tax=Brevibacillus TaxID=55080 RepID=UPI000E3717D7|nr:MULTISPECIES: PIG-L family deacetylase [Bacillales]MBR8658591.1 PIG-L family deacetylase [Brevibacillus sp. NL20B1]REK62260.1 MAG: PIG-L domain-containing protein [Brevibacillus sp.]UFJ60428.1 PIG-L family deacetylase [Anoxybacillus sediminis]